MLEGRKQSVKFGQACEEIRCEEVELDGEGDTKKKLGQRTREII